MLSRYSKLRTARDRKICSSYTIIRVRTGFPRSGKSQGNLENEGGQGKSGKSQGILQKWTKSGKSLGVWTKSGKSQGIWKFGYAI